MKSAKKIMLIAQLSIKNIYTNRAIYNPYLFAGGFAIFVYFVLSSIIYNDLVHTLRHSTYIYGLMIVGLVLLGIIMIPFLFYTHSFLLKQRKKEFALYSILGLGKGHVMLMLFFEAILSFGIVMIGGVLSGIILSKFLFLILLNLSGMPSNIEFTFNVKAFVQTGGFFLGLYIFIYIVSLRTILSATPIKLLKGQKQNDIMPKHPIIQGFIGMVMMMAGYIVAIQSRIESNIFSAFFLAVFFVIFGTYLLFRSGIHLLMQVLKRRKSLYYKSKNFITFSGIHQRVNKSSASLANICIFSTMVIITLICTVSLFRGRESIHAFRYPVDAQIVYDDGDYPNGRPRDVQPMLQEIERLKKIYGIEEVEVTEYSYWEKRTEINEDFFGLVRWMTKEEALDLNISVGELRPGEIMTFSTGPNLGFQELVFKDKVFPVQKELMAMKNISKARKHSFSYTLYIIGNDEEQLEEMLTRLNGENLPYYKHHYDIQIDPTKDKVYFSQETSQNEKFINSLKEWVDKDETFTTFTEAYDGAKDVQAMSGGLLFLGLFCSVIFIICFIIIMYYKQLAEGYDDRYNFDILQKVGMDQKEVKGTILRQIVVVFAIPLLFAILHTLMGLEMVITLFGTIGLYDERIIRWSGVGVIIAYSLIYIYIYFKTSKTYYRIIANDK